MAESGRFWTVVSLAGALFAAACAPMASDQATGAGLPMTAPDYRAVALAGDSVSLKGQLGKVVLLNVWATWCPPCVEEMPMLQKLHDANSARGFQVIGVSVDAASGAQRVQSFLTKHGITFPIWLDPDDRASYVFRAPGVPSSYLIDRTGTVVWKTLGPLSDQDSVLRGALEKALAATQ